MFELLSMWKELQQSKLQENDLDLFNERDPKRIMYLKYKRVLIKNRMR